MYVILNDSMIDWRGQEKMQEYQDRDHIRVQVKDKMDLNKYRDSRGRVQKRHKKEWINE